MDIHKYLILIKGEDQTRRIQYITYKGGLCIVRYANGEFHYSRNDVQWLNIKKVHPVHDNFVEVKGMPVPDVETVCDFGKWYRLIYKKDYSEVYPKREVKFYKNVLNETYSQNVFRYFRELASRVSLIDEENHNILSEQYCAIESISHASALGSYLTEDHSYDTYKDTDTLIYPFGLNRSQKKAVENAMTSQISLIEGPPGTGKTQTILNIISNIVIKNKTVAVVSNNNAAIQNVIDKLKKYNLDFFTALLGNSGNKNDFIKNQTGQYPSFEELELTDGEKAELDSTIKSLTDELNEKLKLKDQIAVIKSERDALETESRYYEEYFQSRVTKDVNLSRLSSKKLLEFWNEFEFLITNKGKINFFKKLYLGFKYNWNMIRLLKEDPENVIPFVQNRYYNVKREELDTQEKNIQQELKYYDFDKKIQRLVDLSLTKFKIALSERFFKGSARHVFDKNDFKSNVQMFVREYPVVLSTTYSIKKSLKEDFLYDYLIIDEASQVDLVTGVLALSCAKNIVIVGDLKQLPNVITKEQQEISDKLKGEDIDEAYDYACNSLLSSAEKIWESAPCVLLREHYRCNPKIINFCNQYFYDSQLIVMTEDDQEISPLMLYKTVKGNHAREHINLREVDVIKNEILPELNNLNVTDIGIITPYRDQVKAIRTALPDYCEVDTVHKFQGREKQVIILSSVDNRISDFVNDEHMLNVAVSRAVNSLIVVTSGNKANKNTLYGDLAKYIEYNNFQIIESKIYSVFDMLYKGYFSVRKEFLRKKKRVSEYDSENLMYALIEQILKEKFTELDCACHVTLSTIVKEQDIFNDREKSYIRNPLTHVDFLLFHKMDKLPVLVIEVDGTAFHQEGSQQAKRDKMKNRILKTSGLPLLRLRTDGSREKEQIIEKLNEILEVNNYETGNN